MIIAINVDNNNNNIDMNYFLGYDLFNAKETIIKKDHVLNKNIQLFKMKLTANKVKYNAKLPNLLLKCTAK